MPSTSSLDAFQRDFTAALLGETTSEAARRLAEQPGFAVYRNTVLRACIEALAANFPTVATLVGPEWFEDAAGLYARACLPRHGCLAAYGEHFPGFLEELESAAGLPYLRGVARLDRAWTEAHLAADAPVLEASALAGVAPEDLVDAVLVPHPAARWVGLPEAPIFAIWRRHREQTSLGEDLAWQGDAGLLTRPRDSVLWQSLPAPAEAFLAGCARGLPFAAAVEQAVPPQAEATGIDRWLPPLVAAGAFTRLDPRAR